MALIMLDCFCIILSFMAPMVVRAPKWVSIEGVNLAAMFLPIYLGISISRGAYSQKYLLRPDDAAIEVFISCMFTMLAILCVLYLAHVSDDISRLAFGIGVALSTLTMVAARWPFSRYVHRRTLGSVTDELLILDEVRITAIGKVEVIEAEVAHITPDINDPFMLNRLGSILRRYDRAVIACPPERYDIWALVLKGANIRGEIIVPHFSIRGAIGIGQFEHLDTQIVSRGPLSMPNRAKKRFIDLAITTSLILALTPLFLIVALLIKLESPGPVFFLQDRVGRGNRLFRIIKFRSMYAHLTDENGATSVRRVDSRVTRVGAFIRKYSIDELPQLFNVLLGDMSLVGPRPHALGSTADDKPFWQVSDLYWCRHSLKPGITGLAQIRGFRGNTEREADLQNRLQADLEYVSDWSIKREIYILLATVKVLAHRNAY
jgi:exopolysaccharide biosynthesis polyprenyl glycosylphosphotransferase